MTQFKTFSSFSNKQFYEFVQFNLSFNAFVESKYNYDEMIWYYLLVFKLI
jgi:hypothetical protein